MGGRIMLLSTREKGIIEMLLKYQSNFVKIYDIAHHLGVSSRTVHRELKSLESFLDKYAVQLRRVNKKGIQLTGDNQAINALKSAIQNQSTVDLSEEEQKVAILYALIQTKSPIKQYSLAHEMGVSNQTLTKLLDSLERSLERYQLQLHKKRGEGIHLSGAESKKRELLSQLMVNNLNSTSVYSVIENHFVYHSINDAQLSMVDIEKIFEVERMLMDFLDQLPYALTESSYLSLTVHIVLSIDRMLNNEYVAINKDIYHDVNNTLEYKVATALALQLEHIYGVQFTEAEITFITIHLRGAKRKNANEIVNDDNDEERITTFIDFVISDTGLAFYDKPALTQGLTLHIIPAINRLKANIETYNPMTEMIKQKYNDLFHSVALSLEKTWPDFDFPDSEIAFIVLHFGGALKTQRTAQYNLLVVCSSGIGTSRLLASRLTQAFTDINSIKQASVGDLNQLDLQAFDAIISTVDLDINEPYITVNPLLPETDINHVTTLLNNQQPKSLNPTQTFPTDSITTNIDDVMNEIRIGLTLIDNVNIEHISLSQDWLDYITDNLYQQEVIADTTSFAERMKQIVLHRWFTLDPYPILMPHLKSEIILKPLILITILNEPIEFHDGQNGEVKIKYLINMFIPPSETLAQMVSVLSESLVEHLDNLDQFLTKKEHITEILQQQYLNQLKTNLTME